MYSTVLLKLYYFFLFECVPGHKINILYSLFASIRLWLFFSSSNHESCLIAFPEKIKLYLFSELLLIIRITMKIIVWRIIPSLSI